MITLSGCRRKRNLMKIDEISYLKCPNADCNGTDSITIEVVACIRVQDPNMDVKYHVADLILEQDDKCCCNCCGYVGILKDFVKTND